MGETKRAAMVRGWLVSALATALECAEEMERMEVRDGVGYAEMAAELARMERVILAHEPAREGVTDEERS